MLFFRDLIARWNTVSGFAEDVGANERTAMSWWQRDSIPAAWFKAVSRAAQQRPEPPFQEITIELLADRAERRRLAGERARQGEMAVPAA